MHATLMINPAVGCGQYTAAGKLGARQEVLGSATALLLEISALVNSAERDNDSGDAAGGLVNPDLDLGASGRLGPAGAAVCGALGCVEALLKCTLTAAAAVASDPSDLDMDPDLARLAEQGQLHRPPSQAAGMLRSLCISLSRYLLAGPRPAPSVLPATGRLLGALLRLSMPPPASPSSRVQQAAGSGPVGAGQGISSLGCATDVSVLGTASATATTSASLSRLAAPAEWEFRSERALLAVELLSQALPASALRSPLLAPRLLLLRRLPALPPGWAGAEPWARRLPGGEAAALRLVQELLQPLWRALQAQYDATEEAMVSEEQRPASSHWSCLGVGLEPEVGK